MRIWKFPLAPFGGDDRPMWETTVKAPVNTKFISFAYQNGKPVIWGIVDNDQDDFMDYRVHYVMTGEEFDTTFRFLGTSQHPAGLVAHVFVDQWN